MSVVNVRHRTIKFLYPPHFAVTQYDFAATQHHFAATQYDFAVTQPHFAATQYDFAVVQYHFAAVQCLSVGLHIIPKGCNVFA